MKCFIVFLKGCLPLLSRFSFSVFIFVPTGVERKTYRTTVRQMLEPTELRKTPFELSHLLGLPIIFMLHTTSIYKTKCVLLIGGVKQKKNSKFIHRNSIPGPDNLSTLSTTIELLQLLLPEDSIGVIPDQDDVAHGGRNRLNGPRKSASVPHR